MWSPFAGEETEARRLTWPGSCSGGHGWANPDAVYRQSLSHEASLCPSACCPQGLWEGQLALARTGCVTCEGGPVQNKNTGSSFALSHVSLSTCRGVFICCFMLRFLSSELLVGCVFPRPMPSPHWGRKGSVFTGQGRGQRAETCPRVGVGPHVGLGSKPLAHTPLSRRPSLTKQIQQ